MGHGPSGELLNHLVRGAVYDGVDLCGGAGFGEDCVSVARREAQRVDHVSGRGSGGERESGRPGGGLGRLSVSRGKGSGRGGCGGGHRVG
jgi:hypothetical protein